MKKAFRSPKPGCSNTEKTRGKSGEKKILICSKCGTEGIVLFPKIGGKNNVTEVTVLSRRKKIALASLAIIFLITISFIVIPASNGSLHFLTVLVAVGIPVTRSPYCDHSNPDSSQNLIIEPSSLA